MAFSDVDIASTYLMRRLASTRQAEKLSASMQFDLARSPLNDDELDEIVDQFRDSPRPAEGWGLSGVLREVLSSEPKRIPVSDLKALQRNLIAQGYAPPDAVATGDWDPSWYASFRRFDRDNFEEQRSGQHWYSAPVYSGTKALVNTLPSRVFQGIVGGAKGLVAQSGETASRVGLLGGAAAGAGIGAAIGAVGGPIGAGAGALGGAAIGFIADLFTSDEGEEGQSLPGALVDALTPWEEYKDNPRAAWEDLGFVLTASSFATGIGLAAKGVTAGAGALAGLRAGTAGGEVASAALPGIFGSTAGAATGVAQQVAKPGLSWMKAAMMPTKLATQTELGAFGTVARHVTKGALFKPGTHAKTADWLAKYSPIAFANRVGPKVALDVFGGLSQASMGARLFGGIGQGTKTALLEAQDAMKAELGRDLTEDEVASLEKTVSRSTIEQEISKAPQLKTGIDVPLLGDVVDLAAFMLYPQRLLPFSGARAAKAANNVLKADHLRLSYIHALMDESKRLGKPMSFSAARAKSAELVNPLEHTWHMMEYGIHAEAHLRIASQYSGRESRAIERGLLGKTKADIRRELLTEAKRFKKGEAPTLQRVMGYAMHDETLFEKWLVELNMDGRGLSRLPDNREANKLAAELERDIVKNQAVIVRDEASTMPKIVWPTETARVRPVKNVPNLDVATVQDRIADLELRIGRAERASKRGANSPTKALLASDVVRIHKAEVESLKKTLVEMRKANSGTVVTDLRLAPARLDFVDKQGLLEKRAEFLKLRDEVVNAEVPNARIEAHMRLSNFVRELETDGIITEKLRDTALGEKPGMAIANTLERQSKSAASRFELPPQISQKFEALGYKLVETGEDVIFPSEIDGMMELVGVGDYTRRAAFWETLGLSTLSRENLSIAKLRDAYVKAELGDALKRHKVKLSPRAANDRLFRYLDERNHSGAVIGPLRVPKKGKVGLYGTNIRDLSLEDIRLAFEDVPGVTEEAAKDIFGALRRGSAYGAEAKFLHPMDSARALAHGMRVQGMPAISDYMRSLHAEVPTRLNRRAWRQGEVRYTPVSELAHSPQRKRVEVALHDVALRAEANITEGQRNFAMALMDSTVQSQVRAGRFKDVDEAYGLIDAAFAERYLGDATGALFKRTEAAPSFEDLKLRARAYSDTKDWYRGSGKAIASLPLYGTQKLANGETITDLELFTQIVAATSPQKQVKMNIADAWANFKVAKSGGDAWVGAVDPGQRGMLDDILRGHTIDKWGPARTTRITKAGKVRGVEHHRRPKVENFYWNLKGEYSRVTNDGWMARLFGHADGKMTNAQYDEITAEVTRVADDLGWEPAQVQAALWASARDDASDVARMNAAFAEEAGDLAAAKRFRAEAKEIDKAEVGQYTPAIERELAEANPYGLMQRVEDEVHGLTEFGPDFATTMRFFRTGDFSTLVHENAHMLRGLLAPEDLAQLERAYGVRPTGVTPHGPGDDLRSIADEYHQQSGIKTDRRALEEYSDVDEARAMRIADAYEAAKTAPKSRATKKAYKAFMTETMAQYRLLVSRGYKMVPWAEGDAPYKGAREFIKDARENKRNFYFKTADDQIPANHPLAQYSGVTVMDSAGNAYPQKYNDIFRTVHDLFGHAKEGVETGARGEENAWRQHARMYSSEARKAMTTETRGQNSWVNFGKHLRQGGRVPKKGEPGFVIPQERPYAEQKAFLLPDEFTEVDTPFAWPREAEERFATDAERYILGKTKLADAPPAMGVLKHSLGALWGNVRGHGMNTNLVPRAAREVMDKHFADALKLIPESRLSRLQGDIASKQTAGGAAIGAVAGAVESDEDRLGGALRGAAIGAGAGLVGRQALKRTYGYLPDALQRMNTALRYTLSFTFDAGRISEQNMIAAAKFNLPPMMSPVNYTKGKAWGRSPYRSGQVRGQEAWDDAVRLYDEVNGANTFASNIDDLDRRMYQAGMLGFSPRNWEIAQTWQLWQRGEMSAEQIREAVAQIGRYGTRQTAIERSANFVVFPFSFSKKLLTTLGDFVMQHPGRNLLIHEGLRRYQESEADDKVRDFLSKHAPLLEELKGINNLVFGLSPGRFFLAGVDDHRSGTGKAAQLMSSLLVPSGAATTLAQAAGNSADLAINAFVPLTITDESINRAGGIKNFMDVMRRYVPFIRELDQYIIGVGDDPSAVGRQWTALMEGADPYYQFSAYQDGLRVAKSGLDPLASAMGYASTDGLLQSDFGAMVAPRLEANEQELRERYPTGFRMSQEFTNKDVLDSQALVDLANKENRAAGEDHILEVVEHIQNRQQIAELVGFDPQMSSMVLASSVRSIAEKYAGDPRFAELWDRFFLREYGPLRRVA